MESSPFVPICNELAAEFDTAEDTNNIEMTKALLDKAKKILADHDSPEYAPLFMWLGHPRLSRETICFIIAQTIIHIWTKKYWKVRKTLYGIFDMRKNY